MGISPIITAGYGAWGGVQLLPTAGFTSSVTHISGTAAIRFPMAGGTVQMGWETIRLPMAGGTVQMEVEIRLRVPKDAV